MDTEVVIIGAGLGGLSLAVDLALHGHRVIVLEAHSVVGGYAHAFRRGHHRFDVSLHHVGGLGPDGTLGRVLERFGVVDQLEVRRRETLFRLRRPDLDLTLPNGRAELLEALVDAFPRARSGLAGLFDELDALKHAIVEPWLTATPASAPASVFGSTFLDLYRRHLDDPRLLGVLGQLLWMYVGLPPSQVIASFSTCVLGSSFLQQGYYIEGGGAALSEALAKRLRSLGGTCLTKRAVARILVDEGRAWGVELANGERITAEVVVSNADPQATLLELVGRERLSRVFCHRLAQMQPSLSSYALYLGLDRPASALGIEDENLFFAHDHDLDAAHARVLAHEIDHTDWGLTNCGRLDPTCAPSGGGVLSFFELTPARDWHRLSRDDYRDHKREVEQRLLDKYERTYPGLREHARHIELGTPRTNTRYSRNHLGAIYGFAQTLDQAGRRRLNPQTPIRDLYLVGAWTWAGGGYEGAVMSGIQTSMAVRDRLQNESKPMNRPLPIERFPFTHTLRVYLEDTDALGIAFHGAYINFLERGRTEAFVPVLQAELGVSDWRERYLFNVYRIDITYLKPSKLGDVLTVHTRFEPASKFRFVATQEIRQEASGLLLVKARTEVIVIDRAGNLLPLPPELLELPNIGGPA